MSTLAEFFARLFVPPTRRTRSAYEYVTGNRTCVGFVRAMVFIVVLGQGIKLIDSVRQRDLAGAGVAVFTFIMWLALTGPIMFREAAAGDAAALGPSDQLRRPDIMAVIYGALCLAVAASVPVVVVAKVLATDWAAVAYSLCTMAIIPAEWAAETGKGGGRRTLVGDIRKHLTGNRSPEAVPS